MNHQRISTKHAWWIYLSKTFFTMCQSLCFIVFISALNVYASSGIAVTGTFSDYHFKLLPGETIEHSDIYVIFYNYYDTAIEVILSTDITHVDDTVSSISDHVFFILDDSKISIGPGQSYYIPIRVSVLDTAPAGEYYLGLAAYVIPYQTGSIVVTGSAELRTNLSIYGEAGELEIRAFDMFDEAMMIELKLFRKEGNTTLPVRKTDNGILIDRFVVGEYLVVGTYKTYEVLRETFLLKDQEETILHLQAQTVFIENITISPLISVSSHLLSRIQVEYTLINIHDDIENISIVLNSSFNDNQLERSEEDVIPFLPESNIESSFKYLSATEWQSGTYEMMLEIVMGSYLDQDSMNLGHSKTYTIFIPLEYVEDEIFIPDDDININIFENITFLLWVLSGIGIIFITTYIVLHSIKKNKLK